MQRLLYFMGPWGWIKQRPHFLAEALGGRYDVTVFSPREYRPSRLKLNAAPHVSRSVTVWRLPLDARVPFLLTLSEALVRAQVSRHLRPTDLVWIAHPSWYGPLRRHLTGPNRLVYDCMDDYLELPDVRRSASRRTSLRRAERALCARASLILASSEHLKTRLIARYGLAPGVVSVVNNGVDLLQRAVAPIPEALAPAFRSPLTKFVYVGTVAEWFDFDLVLETLREHGRIEYLLIGPATVSIPRHERLRHLGPVPHELVPAVMAAADALVMPFRVNELVQGVDPVKAYEYIAAGKPAILVRYAETEKFGDYAHLYSGRDEYARLIGSLADHTLASPPASGAALDRFRADNTWHARAREIARLLETARPLPGR